MLHRKFRVKGLLEEGRTKGSLRVGRDRIRKADRDTKERLRAGERKRKKEGKRSREGEETERHRHRKR